MEGDGPSEHGDIAEHIGAAGEHVADETREPIELRPAAALRRAVTLGAIHLRQATHGDGLGIVA